MNAKEATKLNALKADIRDAWQVACQTAGVPTDSKFVVFETSNPAAKRHNDLMGEYFKLVKRIRANENRRARHNAMISCGLTRVRVNGKVMYE